MRTAFVALVVVAGTGVTASVVINPAYAAVPFEVQSLNGAGNNVANPTWGQAGTNYTRVGPVRYADGIGTQAPGPNSRLISNRIFNDGAQNLFSERGVTQWGFVWGQFLDHTFGLREAPGVGNTPDPSSANIGFDPNDPLEEFENTLGEIPFTRSTIAPGTGVTTPRQQINTVSSYIEASAVYGDTTARLEWLREGPVDGNLANNSARLLLPNNYLPRRDARGNAATAPAMDVDGRLRNQPARATTAGDVRANENIALTATHTLFAREHNRIVGLLPSTLSEEDKFQIARRVVSAEQQYITYQEWLPAMGVQLPAYTGYRSNVNANLTNEFATVGYRAHSQIHGELEMVAEAADFSPAQLAAIEAQGVEILAEGDELEFVVPLNVAFFNPDLLEQVRLENMLRGIGLEPQYKNDEQIDNQLRSVLFQIPVSGNPECLDGPELPACFNGVVDLGAIDVERARDHGMPTYNQMRQAYGLAPKTSFTAITGESTDAFPAGTGVNNPNSIDFTALFDVTGDSIELGSEEADAAATAGVRRSTVAARLRAIYGSVDNIDAFTGMVAEAHLPGSEFGELQRAIWLREFTRLRDGDRFFHANDPALTYIRNTYGIDHRRTLSQIISSNTGITGLAANVFFDGGHVPPVSCRVTYQITTQWPGNFQVNMRITNTGNTPIPAGWKFQFSFPSGQEIFELWNGVVEQVDRKVLIVNVPTNGVIPAGGSVGGIGFNATRVGNANAVPTNFTVNTTRCTTG